MKQWALTKNGRYVKGGVRETKGDCWNIAAKEEDFSEQNNSGESVTRLLNMGYGVLRVKVKSVGHIANEVL